MVALQRAVGNRATGAALRRSAGFALNLARHGGFEVGEEFARRLEASRGRGRPVPDAARERMEAAPGAEFSEIRMHVAPNPEEIGAAAFTTGSDIYFASGGFERGSGLSTFSATPNARTGERVPARPASNRTGLPDKLKAGVEALSGLSVDGVRVHRNSTRPAAIGAVAYAQGRDIYLGPGEEKHLPHEAWHVVQQAQGRVKPTMKINGAISVNVEAGLEREATAMGARALSFRATADVPALGPGVDQLSSGATVQLWPPVSVEEASIEVERLKPQLFERGIKLIYTSQGKERGPFPILPGNIGTLIENLKTAKDVKVDPGNSQLPPEDIVNMLTQLMNLREWLRVEQASSGTFGYGAVESIAFPPPSPFHQTYSLSPFAPHLHGMPIGAAPEGSTFERLGDDMVIRQKLPEELERQRESSKAYRRPGEFRIYSTPPFSSGFLSGSTMLDDERLSRWRHEKRGEIANTGLFKGQRWPTQQEQLGGSGAQDAVVSYNETTSDKLPVDIPYEWLHLFAFSIGGLDNYNPQDARNFVVGTQHANYYHLIYERIAKDLAREHQVLVRARPEEELSAEWRIYRRIVYTISLMDTYRGTFNDPEPISRPRRSITRVIPCLETLPVHVSDYETLRHSILQELGIITPEYQRAVEAMLAPVYGSGSTSRDRPERYEDSMELDEKYEHSIELDEEYEDRFWLGRRPS
jgi:hypothetical protein